MKIKLFWQPNCPKCPKAKELCDELEKEGVVVERYNTAERDGLAEASFYSIATTPVILLVDDNEDVIKSWQGEMPTKKEVVECITQMIKK